MTDEQVAKARALSRCSFIPGSNTNRFVRNMVALAERPESSLTPRQAEYLIRLCYSYRGQLARIVDADTLAGWVADGEKLVSARKQSMARAARDASDKYNGGKP